MDFYIQASKILTKLDNKNGSIKGLTLQSGEKNGPRTYALILETLKYRDVLKEVISRTDLLKNERKLAAQGQLALVLVHDLLLNKGGIVANAGPFKDAVMRHKTRLNAEWIKAKIRLKVKDNTELAKTDSTFVPRWARVNTLKVEKSDLLSSMPEFTTVRNLKDLTEGTVYIDEHIDNLLAFHPQQNLMTHRHYLEGRLIFQNKASCIPAAILQPPPGASVIDACAAPGNKTSHLASILNQSGSLFAFERDNRRVEVLRTMLQKAGADVHVTHGDFTRCDPFDAKFQNVSHLLLDPSCSGSGIVNRLDYLTASGNHGEDDNAESVEDRDRLEALASFQLKIVLHAMKFPMAKKIVYSTCSIHAIENEHVVMQVLRQNPEWSIAPRADSLPSWPIRGKVEECVGDHSMAEGLIRSEPGELGTIGFFVACFVKQGSNKRTSSSLFVSDSGGEEDEVALQTTTNKRKKRKKKKKVKQEAIPSQNSCI